ncbi:MAG: hypothetical protein H7Y88_06410 [Phycisphaerales bacterium]|nr:hypothetical protein [Phycisphaerales bacterium]
MDSIKLAGVNKAVYEEGETGIAMARHVMERRGVDAATIKQLLGALRKLWKMED